MGRTSTSIDSPPFAAGCHDQTEAPYERGRLVVTRTSVTRSLIAQRRRNGTIHFTVWIRANTRSPHQFPYPERPLRESAEYLVADIFYKQKDWRGALAEFE